MKPVCIIVLFLIGSITSYSSEIYLKTFGSPSGQPVIFLHGGPGYNSAGFEFTTAQKLADKKFFVIVYDRRGEGRSPDKNAAFTFKQTFDDLDSIYSRFGINKAILIGHSFGGVVGTLFTKLHPEKVNTLFLVGAPVTLQETFKNILEKCEVLFRGKNDENGLANINFIRKMDTASMQYCGSIFQLAINNGLYYPKKRTDAAIKINKAFKADTAIYNAASKMQFAAPLGFWQNEHYTTIDLTGDLRSLVKNNVKVKGLYGKEDGLYNAAMIDKLSAIIGTGNLVYSKNCSHGFFIDQQDIFLDAIAKWAE